MRHIDTFTIGRFRGIQDLKLEELGQINLLVGDNNSGKTSVLEALSLYSSPLDARKWRQVANSREVLTNGASLTSALSLVDRLTWLFFQQESDESISPETPGLLLTAPGFSPLREMSANYRKYLTIEQSKHNTPRRENDIEVEHIQIDVSTVVTPPSVPNQPALFDIDEYQQRMLDFSDNSRLSFLDVSSQSIIPTQLLSPFSHRLSSLQPRLWSDVVTAELKDSTLELLRSYDPKIQDMDLVLLQGIDSLRVEERRNRVVLSVKHQQLGRAPLSTFGDGLRRIFTLATAIPQSKNGFLLIDELETSIHTKAHRRTFEWLVKACIKNNVQLFATTHSLETVDAVIDVCKDDAIDLVAYRLEQREKQTGATRFDKGLLTRLREELGMEIR